MVSRKLLVAVALFVLCPALFAQVAGDGAGPSEQVYTNNTSGYTCYWSGFATAESNMQVLVYVNNTSGAPIFTTTTTGIAYAASGTYTASTLTLTNNTVYVCEIYSLTAVGAIVQYANSPGIKVDTTTPVAGTVNNTNGSGATITYQSSTSVLYGNWSGFSEAISGISNYAVGIGTAPNIANVVPLTTYANAATNFTFSGLSLTNGTKYYAVVQAINGVGGIIAVAGGRYSTTALKNDGTVWAWGDNTYGELGNGVAGTNIYTPVQVVGPGGVGFLTGITAIAGGSTHTLALRNDGTVWAWGSNNYNELGDGTTIQRNTPVQVATGAGVYLTGIIAISGANSVAVRNDGTVWTWGYNLYGELGDGTTTQRAYAVQVKGPGGVGFLTGITSIAEGQYHTIALKNDGTVWAWGNNSNGELGNNSTTQSNTPVQVEGNGGVGFLTGITAITCGANNGNGYSIALRNDGTMWTWGANVYGYLGDTTTIQRNTPVEVATGLGVYLSGITAIGKQEESDHTIALRNDGTVWTWGYNLYGQLGNNTTTDSHTPVQVEGVGGSGFLTGIVAIASGAYHTVALKNDGTVWTWGDNTGYSNAGSGQLGNNSAINSSTPVQVVGFGSTETAVSSNGVTVDTDVPTGGTITDTGAGSVSGGFQSSATTINANWANWSDATAGMLAGASTYQVGVVTSTGATVVAMTNYANTATSAAFTGLTLTSGTKYYVILVAYDSVGNATAIIYSNGITVDTTAPAAGAATINGGAAYQSSSAVINGAWANWSDALSGVATYSVGVIANDFNTGTYTVPLTAYANTATSASFTGLTLVSGTRYYLAVRATDNVGNVAALIYSNPVTVDTTPPIAGTVNITNSGGTTIYFQNYTNAIYTNWSGFNDPQSGIGYYEWAIGTTPGGTDIQPFTYAGLASSASNTTLSLTNGTEYYATVRATNPVNNIIAIAGGEAHTVALKSDGTVWDWGWNLYGQLGDGTTTNRTTPVQVSGLTGITAIAGGEDHTIALKSDGTVWAWGLNSSGQLGDGTTTNRTNPVQVSGLTGITAIAGGEYHTIALKSDGTVWTWGWNLYGQLGDGTTTNRTTPVQVSGLTGITAIASGFDHTMALKNDGTVWTWGWNANGQLGDGTTTNRTTPVQVSGLTGITAIAGGRGNHTIALKNDGTVWTWGWNLYGQLGDGTTTDRTTPVQVSGLTVITAIAGGYYKTMALKNDGTVWTWGYNSYGQLGDGTTTNRTTPVQVSGLTGITAIASGFEHTMALKNDGTVWTWGYNVNGQLGDGTTTQRNTPVYVIGLTGMNVVASSMPVTVDTDAPAGGTITDAGGGTVSGGFQSSTNTINANWANWGDVTAGMLAGASTYQIGVVTSNGTQIVAMTNYANTATSASFTGLTLTSGTKYYVILVAYDSVGNATAIIYSNGITVDTTAPVNGTVNNTNATGATIIYQNWINEVYTNWSGFSDALSGVANYSVGVLKGGTGVGATYVVPLTSYANTATSATFASTAFTSGGVYYIAMQATDNVGNISALVYSNGVTMDTVAPVNGTVNNTNALGATIIYQNWTNNIYTNWSGFSDALSGVANYSVGILTGVNAPGVGSTYLVPLANYANTTSSATFTGLTLTNGTHYYIAMQATDGAGNVSALVYSNGVTVDTDVPGGGTVTDAGGGTVSGGFQSSATTINANWANWSDATAAVTQYQVGIQIWGGANIYALSPFAAGTSSYAFTGLSLASGTKYYVVFTATDSAGNVTSVIYSNGITVDTAPPVNGTVNNTNATGGTIIYQNWTNEIYTNWSGFSDTLSGVANYSVGVLKGGTGVGATYVVPLTSYANTATSATFSGLAMTVGGVYYIAMQATDAMGNTSALVYSNGVTIVTGPAGGVANNTNSSGATITFQNSTNTLNANWSGWTDAAAAINTYQVGVVTNPLTGAYIVALQNYATTLSNATFTGLTLTSGTKYYIQVTAVDALSNSTTVYSSGVTVDTSLVSGAVNNGLGANVSYQASTTAISANWSGFSDTVSGVATYQVGVGTTPGATNVVGLTTYANTATSATFTGLTLTVGTTYYVTITATSGGGFTTTANSSGITIASAPTITSFSGTPTSGIAPVSITFTSVITSSTSPLASVVYNFGDGSTLSAASAGSVSHTYTTAGTYYANVTATNGVGSATSTTAVVITAPPTAPGGLTITASTANGTTIGTAPFPVTFTFGSTSTDISRYSLSFGDAGIGVYQYVSSTAGSTTYSYTLAGSYTVYLNAVNTSGIGSTIAYANAIVVSAPTAPTFSVAPAASPAGPYNVGQTVTFTATGAAGAGATGAAIYYQWDFNGDNIIDVSTPAKTGADTETFTYTSPGTYTVTCIISDSNGGGPRMSAKATISVSVAAPSPANIRVWLVQPYSNISFYGNSMTINANAVPASSVNFSTLKFQYSANGGASWLDGIINSSQSAAQSAIFVWDTTLVSAGTYLVRVQVTDVNGFVHSSTDAGQQGAITVTKVATLATANTAEYTITSGKEEFTNIDNNTGASVTTIGSGVSCNITMPANATTLTGGGKIYLDTLSSNPAPSGTTTGIPSGSDLTGFCEISVTDSTGASGTAQITKPMGVVIGYTSTDGVTIDGTTISVSSLQLMHYNKTLSQWETLPGQVLDTTHKTVTSTAGSLSPFALAGLAVAEAAGGGAGGGLGLGGLAAVALCGTTGFDALLALGLVLLLNRYLRKRKVYKQS